MLILRNAAMGDFKPTPEQIKQVERQWADWMGGIAAQGKYAGGYRPGDEGKTVRAGNLITDGPCAEVKEMLLGVLVVKANSMD